MPARHKPVAHGPLRRIVERHELTASEMAATGLEIPRVLLTLECGHHVLRMAAGEHASARCGMCAETE